MKPSVKILSTFAFVAALSSGLYASDYDHTATVTNSDVLTLTTAKALYRYAVDDLEAKKALRNEARAAWKRARLSGDEARIESALEAFQEAKAEAKEAVSAYHEARRIKFKLELDSQS